MTTANRNPKESEHDAAIALAAYNKALSDNEAEALEVNSQVSGGNTPSGTPPKDWHEQQIAKIVVWATKKVASLVGKELGIPTSVSDTAIDALASLQGLTKKEKSEQQKQYEDLAARLDDLQRGQDQLERTVTKMVPIKTLNTAITDVRSIWDGLKEAAKLNDAAGFFECLQKVASADIQKQMQQVAVEVAGPNATGTPLAEILVKECTNKLEHATNTDFDVEQYWMTLAAWRNLVVDLQRMGTALVVLHLQLSGKTPTLKKSYEEARALDCKERIEAIHAALMKDVPDRPGFKALHQVAQEITPEKFWPVRSFRLENGRWLYIEDHWVGQGRNGGGYWLHRLAEDVNNQSKPATRSFALAYDHGKWSMMASPLVGGASQCQDLIRWTYLKCDSGMLIPREGLETAIFKMIPLKGEAGKTGPRVKLIWIGRDESGRPTVEKEWTVEIVESDLSYPSLGDSSRDTDDSIRSTVNARGTQSFICALRNTTSYVFVMDQAYSDGSYHYKNTVWLPGERLVFGAWGQGIRACFRFSVYRLESPSGSQHELGDAVRAQFGMVPTTGTLGLRGRNASLQTYFFVRVKVPTWEANSILVIQMNLDDPNRDLRNLKDPIGLSDGLDGTKSYSNETKGFGFSKVKGSMRVDGGKQTFSWCDLVDA